MGAERWDEQVGSVADEASRLLESLRRTAADAAERSASDQDGPDADSSGPADRPGPAADRSDAAGLGVAGDAAAGRDEAGAAGAAGADSGRGASDPAGAVGSGAGPAHDPFCQWCPLCRGAAVVRSLSPETLSRLADLASLAATVLAELASSRPAGGAPASGESPDAAADPASDAASTPARSGGRPRPAAPAPSRPIPVSDADDPQEAPRG